MTVLAAVRFKPSPPARVESTATQKGQPQVSSSAHGALTEHGNLWLIVVQVAQALTLRDVRLTGQLDVLDAHRVKHDFKNVQDLSKLTEEQDAVAIGFHLGQLLFQLVNLARRHPFVLFERVLLEVLRMSGPLARSSVVALDAAHLVAETEPMQLKVGHDFHVLKDEILVTVDKFELLETITSHLAQHLFSVNPAEQHRMIRRVDTADQEQSQDERWYSARKQRLILRRSVRT